jgi:PAS domain S-box-containing protein
MKKPLHVLVVEDSEADAALLLLELQRHGYKPTYERVETREAMEAALDRQHWDIVIADYTMPNFSAPAALQVLKQKGLDIPFIISTGSIGEAAAVESMRAGADDYVMKGNMERLFPAIERELATAISRRARRRAEQDLAQMAAIIQSTDDAVIGKSLDGFITSWNPAAERLFGYAAEEIIGKPVSLLISPNHPDEEPQILAKIGRGEPVSRYETVRIRKDGRQVSVSLTVSPIKDDSGKIIGASSIARDITERKEAQERLAHLASIPEQSPIPIIETDKDWNITYTNPAAATLFPDLATRKLEHPLMAELGKVALALDHITNKTVMRKIKVRDHHYERAICLIRNGMGMRIFLLDITDQEHLHEHMHRTQKMEAIEQLAGGIAHHFNNLMAGVKGFSELMLQELHPGETIHGYAEKIRNSADRAAILTRQLLNFSQNAPRQTELLDLNKIVTAVEPAVHSLVGDRVQVALKCQPDIGRVKADAVQFEQIIVNLATNARDAMPLGGTLTIETADVVLDGDSIATRPGVPPGSYVMLAIRDTGTGMSEEARAHLFEPFFTTKELNKGTGLGLATCYASVKQSGGHILVQSDAGRGTSVEIYLPKVAVESKNLGPTPKEVALPESQEGGKETLLLVEDETDLRELASTALREVGYHVLEAANGEEAVHIIQDRVDEPIDMLLTDGRMPKMGGKQVAERFRQRYPGSPVLYISGYPEDELRKRINERNTPVLPKPFALSELTRTVRELLDQTPA